MFPFLKKLFADGGDQGPEFNQALARVRNRRAHFRLAQWCRRLAKDWENLNRKARAFLRLASIRLMLRRLCNPI
jgi:transposase